MTDLIREQREAWRREAGLGVCSDPRREFGRDYRILDLLDALDSAERMLADERERIAQEIEADAERRHGEFAADEDEVLRRINERFPDRLTPFTPDHHNRHDDGCHMCGIANAARIARSQP